VLRHEGAQEERQESTLGRWTVVVSLEGGYEDIRRFIHELETTPTFVVIDRLSIGQGQDASKPLVLALSLSTYYRVADNAS
jgi:Tfp pilus assembly protein PilO